MRVSTKGPSKRFPGSIRRREVGEKPSDLVEIRPLDPERSHPTLVTPKVDALDLAEWGSANREFIESLFREKRAVLFRGFEMGTTEAFEQFVLATSEGGPLEYRDRSTPRETYGHHIYNTTTYPPQYRIRLHNEGSYWKTWALKAYFGCLVPAATGGATPIGDMHAVYRRLDHAVREEFARKGWMLVRNYNEGFGLPWQEVFQTEDRAEVESYCGDNGIEWEWKNGDRLRTRQIRPAFRRHPWTGETLWFNHAAFFHWSALEDDLREALLNEFGEEGLPYNTYFGDGSSIDPETAAHVLGLYEEEEIAFPWQPGDVHLIDNMRFAHGRQSYSGERLILVALTEGYSGPEEIDTTAIV